MILEENDIVDNISQSSSEIHKTVNDEFVVGEYGLGVLKKTLEKVNKNLKNRKLPELQLNILKEELVDIVKKNEYTNEPIKFQVPAYTVKIDGDVPKIADYEFIAKIEHGDGGNIINMNPRATISSLPPEFNNFRQKCDVCHSDRERLNTFAVRKTATNELIIAGSSCLKRLMPLDAVKAMLEYAVQLESIRDLLISTASLDYGYGRSGESSKYYYTVSEWLFFCAIAFIKNGYRYINKANAEAWNRQSTAGEAGYIMDGLDSRNESMKTECTELVKKYKTEATELAKDTLEWARNDFDFDEAMDNNPGMMSYFNNLKVLCKRPFIEGKHTGYVASLIALYVRETGKYKKEVNNQLKAESNYVGEVGQKVTVEVKVIDIKSFDGPYGISNLYKFEDVNGNLITWFTSTNPFQAYRDSGNFFKIIGIVKSQEVSKYSKQKETMLKNVKLAK